MRVTMTTIVAWICSTKYELLIHLTTWPCVTEAMYLLEKRVGDCAREKFHQQIESNVWTFADLFLEDAVRIGKLMPGE